MSLFVNVRTPSEEKSDDSKDSYYEELEQVFGHFPQYHEPPGDPQLKN